MYISYWNLRENPFQNIADTKFAYLSNQHREGLARLLYLIEGRKLGGILVGPYGVGKSMILELMAEKVRAQGQSQYLHIDATPIGTLSLVHQILIRLGHNKPAADMSEALEALYNLFSSDAGKVQHLALAIDEAQFLRDKDAFEFLHLLVNLRTRNRDGQMGDSAVTLILSGHTELIQRISTDPSFCQRMQLAWELEPLNEQQTTEYVHHRMRAAGGDIWTFEEDALHEVYLASRGLPRQINNICDISLLLGCAARAPKVGRDLMQQAIHEVNSPLLHGEMFQGARA